MRLGTCSAILSCLLTFARVHAQEPEADADVSVDARLAALREDLLYARYAAAVTGARALLERTDLSAAQRNGALETLAIGQLVTRDQRGARETFTLLFSRDPDHRLGNRDAGPEAQAAFERARDAHSAPIGVTLESTSPTQIEQREPPVITVRLAAGADAIHELRLAYRQGDARDFTRTLMVRAADGASAQARIPTLEGEAEYVVEWYVEAVAPSQTIIGLLADEDEPLALAVPRAERQRVEVLHVSGPTTVIQQEGSVFGKWWFWTVVGVVVMAGAGGAYLLTRPTNEPPSSDWSVDLPRGMSSP
jgi:hypothetical protein